MPKLRPAATDQTNRSIIAVIKYGMAQAGVEPDELALAARVSRATYYDRLRDPGQFRLCELRGIAEKLHIPLEQLATGKI
ncbi:MAG: hypothetical protein LKJ21_07180 [Oscillospiraceae bacterium]|jgi:hypothetical protein|nr:hypothetical protein [Oscillospiraceae bacterium]MCI1990042.1 hypothetical protein [Oscillospiraceae bacterium]MCI2034786.1 hypothetical protein [Oscillospiraceae bacterium]